MTNDLIETAVRVGMSSPYAHTWPKLAIRIALDHALDVQRHYTGNDLTPEERIADRDASAARKELVPTPAEIARFLELLDRLNRFDAQQLACRGYGAFDQATRDGFPDPSTVKVFNWLSGLARAPQAAQTPQPATGQADTDAAAYAPQFGGSLGDPTANRLVFPGGMGRLRA